MNVGEVLSFSVATGGDPEHALAAAISPHADDGAFFVIQVAHDSTCPCMDVPDADDVRADALKLCTCEIIDVRLERQS